MKRFIGRLILFTLLLCVLGEVIVRALHLTSDIPERYVDAYGIQRYKPGQSGNFVNVDNKWNVNKFGWVGVTDTDRDTIVSIIGDSYIENFMNPISCNQGNILKSYFPSIGFFEAGRSGVSFIEAMEMTKILDKEVKPKLHLLYISNDDFYESIANKQRFTDRVQIDLNEGKILKSELKAPKLKKLLYSSKLMYYLYLRFPIFVSSENKGEVVKAENKNDVFDSATYNRLFNYCKENYDTKKIVLVFHPGIKQDFVLLTQKAGFMVIVLDSKGDKTWALGNYDGHWSCYGHHQVAKQIAPHLLLDLSQVK